MVSIFIPLENPEESSLIIRIKIGVELVIGSCGLRDESIET